MKKIFLFLAFVFLFLLPLRVQAADCSITLQAEGSLAGAEFELFRLDAVFESPDEAYAHVLQAGLDPIATGSLDTRGQLTFGALAEGQYLLVGRTLELEDGRICRFDKSLVALPGPEGEHARVVEPKHEMQEKPETVLYRMLKLWEDDQSPDRPDSVQVELYRNGTLSDTVTLSRENNWQYQWSESDPAAEWSVAEIIPSGYQAEYERSGNTFAICNIREAVVIPTEPANPTETTPTDPDKPKLPQTGQLWWPVPLMAFAGTALFALGWLRRKESGDEE